MGVWECRCIEDVIHKEDVSHKFDSTRPKSRRDD